MKWIMKFIANYSNFNGRASRKENAIIMTIVCSVIALGFFIDNILDANYAIALGCTLSVLIPSYSVSVRRLHDLGYSGTNLLRNNIFLTIKMLIKEGEGSNEYGEPPIE